MFIRSWIRLVALTVSRHQSLIQQHPKAISNETSWLLEFSARIVNPQITGVPFKSIWQLTLAVSSSSSIVKAFKNSLCHRMNSYPINLCLVETVLRMVTLISGGHAVTWNELLLCWKLPWNNLKGLVRSFILGYLFPPNSSPKKTAVKSEWCELLSSWTEENKSWLATIGLGKAPRISSHWNCFSCFWWFKSRN